MVNTTSIYPHEGIQLETKQIELIHFLKQDKDTICER